MDIDPYLLWSLIFMWIYFSWILEGGWVHRTLPALWSSLLHCFCPVLQETICFLRSPVSPLPAPTFICFLFPLPLLSLLCSVFVTFLTLFPLVRPYLERKLVSVEGWESPIKFLATGPWDSPSVGGINLSRFFCDSPPHFPGIPLVSLGSPACRLALFLLSAFCLTSASNIRYFSSSHWQAIVHRVAKSWTWLKQLRMHTLVF